MEKEREKKRNERDEKKVQKSNRKKSEGRTLDRGEEGKEYRTKRKIYEY